MTRANALLDSSELFPSDSAAVRRLTVVYRRLDRVDPEAAMAALSSDERARAGRILVADGRRRFVAARAMLRRVLAQRLGADPARLVFRYTPHGKPLLDLPHAEPLHFNLSHSGDHAVIAISRHARLGIDIEVVRPLRNMAAMAERTLTPRERDHLDRQSPRDRPSLFFRYWTHKEAYLKAVGSGLTVALDEVEVDLTLPPERRLVGRPREDDPQPVCLHEISIGRHVCCSLAILAREPAEISLRRMELGDTS